MSASGLLLGQQVDARGQVQATTISIGLKPSAYETLSNSLAVDPETNMVYVVDYGNGDLAVINGSTNSVVAKIPVPSPISVAIDPITDMV